ncbi:hypothetical protein HKX48_003988 [Thoreauomyces humboldtii]|nr:hypothetical protein HKX48_003988 [Thoreauomyces humboldtii]
MRSKTHQPYKGIGIFALLGATQWQGIFPGASAAVAPVHREQNIFARQQFATVPAPENSVTATVVVEASSTTATIATAAPNPTEVPQAIAAEAYFTITHVEPPSVYIDRGSQVIVLTGSNFTSLSAASYSLQTSNITFPEDAVSITVLSDTMLAVNVDTDAFTLNGSIDTTGDIGILTSEGAAVTKQIRWVDPVKSIATRVVPNRVTVAQGGSVSIIGIDLLPPIGNALCVFNTTTVSSSLATWNPASASYACTAPAMSASGVLEVNLLYFTPVDDLTSFGGMAADDLWRTQQFVSTVVNQPLLLYYRAGAPQIVSAQFTGTGAVEVEFDRGVTVYDASVFSVDTAPASALKVISQSTGREAFGCSSIFANPTGSTGRLWYSNGATECRVQRMGPHTFRFNIGAGGALELLNAGLQALKVGDTLTVKPGAVWTAGQQLSQTATGSVVVTGPADPSTIAQPIVRITAPQIVSSCADVTFDLSRTMGALGRCFSSAAFSVQPTSTALQAELSSFEEAFLNSNALVYRVSSASFPVGTFTVSFAVTNFLGGSGYAAFTVTKLNQVDVPYVTIVGPGDDAHLDQLQTVTAEAHATCGTQRPVGFHWQSDDVNVTGVATTVIFQPYSMPVQSRYTFVVQAQYTDVSDSDVWYLNYTFTSELDRVMPVTIRTLDAGGVNNLDTEPNPSPFSLSTSMFDSGYPLASTNVSDFTCIWSCLKWNNGSATDPCYKLETGQDLSVPAECVDADITGFLSPGQYDFAFEAVRIETGAVDLMGGPVTVTVRDAFVPLVGITPSAPHPSAWDPYTLTATVDPASVNGTVSYTYNSETDCGGQEFQSVDLSLASWQSGSAVLSFPAQALLPAGQYCFGVTATDSSGNSGYATLQMAVLEPPAAGYCSPNATSGIAYVDVFRYTCAGWVTDPLATPLFYAFWVRSTTNGVVGAWRNLGPRSESSVLDTVLSAGSYDVTVNITDAAGSLAPTQQVYSLTATTQTALERRDVSTQGVSDSTFAFLNSTILSFSQTGDYQLAQTNLIVALQSLVPDNLNSAYHVQLLALYSQLAASGDVYLDSQSGGPYMLNALQALAGGGGMYNLSMSVAGTIFAQLQALVSGIERTTALTHRCVGTTSAGEAVSILDAVLGTAATGTDIPQATVGSVADILDNLGTCVGRILSCGQAQTFTELYVSRTVGMAQAVSEAIGFCRAVDIPATALSDAGVSSSSCFRYTCGDTIVTLPTAAIGSPSTGLTAGGLITSLSLFTSGGGALTVTRPTQDINVTVTVNSAMLASPNLVCAWYNTNTGGWSTDGCTLGGVDSTAGTANCQCSHLTDFSIASTSSGATSVVVVAPTSTTSVGVGSSAAPAQAATSVGLTTRTASVEPTLQSASTFYTRTRSTTSTPSDPEVTLGAGNPAAFSVGGGGSSPSNLGASPTAAATSGKSVSPGTIAGAIIGALLAAALILALLAFLWRRHNHNQWYAKSLPPPNLLAMSEGVPPARHRDHPDQYYDQQPQAQQLRRPQPSYGTGYRDGRSREDIGDYDNPQQGAPPPRWEDHLENLGSRDRLFNGR